MKPPHHTPEASVSVLHRRRPRHPSMPAPVDRRVWLSMAATGLLALAACSKEEPEPLPSSAVTPPQPPAGGERQAFEAAAAGKGFATGELMAARLARVFFDPQCPHCTALWQASKPLQDRMRMVWMPVAFMAPASALQGALLLASDNPVALMDRHEAALAAGTGGLDVATAAPPAEALASVRANTQLWQRIGGGGVPHLRFRAGSDGPYGMREGQLSTEQLAQLMGL